MARGHCSRLTASRPASSSSSSEYSARSMKASCARAGAERRHFRPDWPPAQARPAGGRARKRRRVRQIQAGQHQPRGSTTAGRDAAPPRAGTCTARKSRKAVRPSSANEASQLVTGSGTGVQGGARARLQAVRRERHAAAERGRRRRATLGNAAPVPPRRAAPRPERGRRCGRGPRRSRRSGSCRPETRRGRAPRPTTMTHWWVRTGEARRAASTTPERPRNPSTATVA